MRLLKWLARIGFASALTGCNLDPDYTQASLAGNYYLGTNYEGFSTLLYGSGWLGDPKPLLGEVDSVAVVGVYVAVCQAEPGKYYLWSLKAESEAAAQATCLGPLTRAACRGQLYRLVGDSTLRLSPIP